HPPVSAGGMTIQADNLPPNVWSPAYVTSPTTFLYIVYDDAVGGSRIPGTITIDASYTGSLTTQMQNIQQAKVEYCARLASDLGCPLWANCGACWPDAVVTAFANKIIAASDPGLEVWVESGNETWNYAGVQFFPAWAHYVVMGGLLGLGGLDAENYTVYRLKEEMALFKAAWTAAGRDPNKVKSALMGHWSLMSYGRLTYAASLAPGFKADAVGCALYMDLGDWTLNTDWSGQLAGWSIPQLHDLMRHWFHYDKTWVLPGLSDYISNVQQYETAI